jgi:AAA domain
VGEQAVGLALLEAHANGRTLNAGQQALVREMACSGARVGLALAPAGTGKTTAMAALARAWEEDGGRVLGLASSANAAQLLRTDMAGQGVHIDVDTVDKLVWLQRNPDARDDPARSWFDRIDSSTLLIVDEAGKSETLALDSVIAAALARGASVRLVGDDKQLASISAGGVLTDIAHTVGAVTLTEVMRFSSRAEAAALMALREGDPAALAFYADNHRIHPHVRVGDALLGRKHHDGRRDPSRALAERDGDVTGVAGIGDIPGLVELVLLPRRPDWGAQTYWRAGRQRSGARSAPGHKACGPGAGPRNRPGKNSHDAASSYGLSIRRK